jgi:ubiquinone/menaquinone biosynthesis C-methylase UbiE
MKALYGPIEGKKGNRRMSLSKHAPSSDASGYHLDAENAAEIARLMKQARIVTQAVGLLPTPIDPSHIQTVLDIGCGPGEWVLTLTQQFPHLRAIGIDSSQSMVNYAGYQAHTQQLVNATFLVMDARAPLAFPDASYDLIHARYTTSWLTAASWPGMMSEYFRLLRPGGILCTTEFENTGVTTSASLNHYNHLIVSAMRQAGHGFAFESDAMGVTAVQMHLFRQAGFVNMHQQAAVLNYSGGTPAHTVMFENLRTGLFLVQPFLIKSGLITEEEVAVLYARTLDEIAQETFCAVQYYLTTWGTKPT